MQVARKIAPCNMALKGLADGDYRVEIYIHLLDLTRNSCKKSNESLINTYKFPLVNFHLQDLSTIIQSSEMPIKS